MRKYILLGLLFFFLLILNAQESAIKGWVRDNVTEQGLIGATVTVKLQDAVITGTVTDADGHFYIKGMAAGRYQLEFSYTGYKAVTLPNVLITSGKETEMDVVMEEGIVLEEAVIVATADKDKAINEMATISARTFSLEEVTRYSGGRNDASRLVSNFAGVAAANDNRNDIVVRGNSPAGILWRLEGIPIPNPNHFSTLGTTGGPVSALNTNLLKNSDFLTSAFPAEYGNALSGVFDVGFRSGNKDKFESTLQLAAFSGLEAMVEGPLGKNKDKSFLLSYRYSFVQLAEKFNLNFGTNATPNYQDLSFNIDLGKSKLGNFKIFGIGAGSNINFIGRDLDAEDFFASKDADSKATSALYLGGLKHTYIIKDHHYVRTTLAYSKSQNTFTEDKYRDTTYSSSYRNTDVNDDIHRLTLHSYLTSKFSAKISSKLGLTLDNRQLISTVDDRGLGFDFDQDGQADLLRIRNINGNVTTVEPYANLKIKSNDQLTYVIGLHAQLHTQTSNFALEPRLGINYTVSGSSAFNLGYGLHSQLQPLPVFFLLIPDDQQNFVASNRKLDFTRSHHFVLGYEYKPNKDWRIKTETYYQSLYNVPVERAASSFSLLNAGADFVFPQISHLVNEGTGRNYGVELTVEKFFSQSYYALFTTSLFQSKYKGSDDIERNTTFNNEYVINALCGKEWKINPKWMLTTDMKFTAAGGRYVTPINLAASQLAGKEVLQQDNAFTEKLSPYLRLDLKIGVRTNRKGWSQYFAMDFQNLTNHQNVFIKRYNASAGRIGTVYQIGFFPDILWRVQF